VDGRTVIVSVLLAFFCLSASLLLAEAQEPAKFRYDVQVTFLTAENWEIVAQQGQQIAQKFHVKVYVSQPCRMDVNIVVGGESEFKASEQVNFKWERDHTTKKSSQPLIIYLTFHYGDTIMETSWRGLIVKAPQAYPQNFEGWFSPRQVARMIENLTFENIVKAIIFALIGVGLAIISRYYFLLFSPLNGIHAAILTCALIGSMLYDSQWGVGYWLITLLSDMVVYQFIKSAKLMNVLVYDLANKNFDLIGIPYYTNPAGKLCAALQSSIFAIKRTFFNQHIEFRFRSRWLPEEKQLKIQSIKPSHTLNKTEPLYLADSANVTELVEAVEEEEETGGIAGVVKGLLRREKKIRKLYFDVEPSECGIPFDNFTLGFEIGALEKLKKWAVDLATENAELKQLLDAKSIQRGQKIAKKHLDEIMAVVGFTEGETETNVEGS